MRPGTPVEERWSHERTLSKTHVRERTLGASQRTSNHAQFASVGLLARSQSAMPGHTPNTRGVSQHATLGSSDVTHARARGGNRRDPRQDISSHMAEDDFMTIGHNEHARLMVSLGIQTASVE